jgi:hypothetical protein
MSWWKNAFIARLFRRPVAPRVSRSCARRFRPSVLVLEDRTVPSGSDMFATATELVLVNNQATETGSNVGATGEEEEPVHGGEDNAVINSVWWKWTPDVDGTLTVDTVGSDFDTILAAYTLDADNNFLPEQENNDISPTNAQSRIELGVMGGTTYYIAVDGAEVGSVGETGSITLNVSFKPANQPPQIDDQSFAVDENSAAGTVVGTVVATDPEGRPLRYEITGGNESGAFAIHATTGEITVANGAALNFEATPSFTLTVVVTEIGSGGLSEAATVTVNLRDVNDAPVLDNTGSMSLAAIDQVAVNNPGTLVSDILASAGGDRVADEDAGALEGIAVIATNNANGTWQFSTNGGATWSDIGVVSDSSARLLAADANTRVRFVPAVGFSGTVTDGITFRAWDQTSGVNGGLGDASVNGGSTAFSTATETASIEVRAVVAVTIQQIKAEVQSLVAQGVLSPFAGSILQIPLQSAQQQLDQGNPACAVHHLKVFKFLVNLYEQFGILTAAQSASLIAKANAVIASIEVS